MLALLPLFFSSAQAIDTNVCVLLDIEYTDTVTASGDRWTSDQDKPARGAYYTVRRSVGGGLWSVVTWGNLIDAGTNAGCTGTFQLATGLHKITVESRGIVQGDELNVYDDGVNLQEAEDEYMWLVPTSGTSNPTVTLPYDDRWSHYALASFALVMYDFGMDETYTVFSDSSSFTPEELDGIVGASNSSKFQLAHDLGHLAFAYADVNGLDCAADPNADEDNCDGNGVNQNDVGALSKEHDSAAACEGVADFYAALVWNELDAWSCAYGYGYGMDWDENGTIDQFSTAFSPCVGDPYNGGNGAPTDGIDWLDDMNSNTDGGTDGECDLNADGDWARSTRWDWLTYFWDMVTDEGLMEPSATVGDVVDMWDVADPNDWEADCSTTDIECPDDRLEDAANGQTIEDAHDEAYWRIAVH